MGQTKNADGYRLDAATPEISAVGVGRFVSNWYMAWNSELHFYPALTNADDGSRRLKPSGRAFLLDVSNARKGKVMRKIVQVLLVSSCVIGAGTFAQAADIGVSIGGKRGINADVSIGGNKGIKADVDASIGGNKGINADVDASIGGNKGVKADVDVSLGGDDGVNADVNANIGTRPGVDVDVGLGIGRDDDPNTANNTNPNNDDSSAATNNNGISTSNPNGVLTSRQLRAFNAMSSTEKRELMKRCSSVGSGGYDAALVNLCKLLRMSASR